MAMSRPGVLTGFHGHGQTHAGQHYRAPAPGHYEQPMVHSALPFARPPPMGAPVLVPAGFNHHQHPHQQRLHPPHAGHHHHARTQHHNQNHAHGLQMADPYMATDDELARLQDLSSKYEPEATGPLVGDRQSSAAITTQYANADPVYQVKTAALPAKYAYFRTCRGDGHCGWRAIAFTYFEGLLRAGDANKFGDEEARLMSMGNLLDHVGYSRDIWMEFAEGAFDLMRKLASSVQAMDGAAADILLKAFNDMDDDIASMSIITYVKLLASAWVQTHADQFSHFVPLGDVKAYCGNHIEPANCEADNIALVALSDVLIKPAGFGLEVWYLDRSPGEEINRSFHAEPEDHQHRPIPNAHMMRLLYRPGHYDILYKAEDVPQPVQQQPVPPQAPLQVNLANYADSFTPAAADVNDVMTMIPGMYPAGGFGQQRWASLSSYDYPSPAPQPQLAPVQPFPATPTPTSSVTSQLDFIIPSHGSHMSQYNTPSHHDLHLDQPSMTLPIHPPPPVTLERAAPLVAERGGPFRPSVYELEPGFGAGMQVQPFQTSIFRNSHFNTAHFMNPDFQPEEWCPDGEFTTGNKGRHKSHS